MSTRLIELGGSVVLRSKSGLPRDVITDVFGMMLQSVGPERHAVNVPFHDSQARGKAILIRTGWDETRNEPGPYLHDDLIFRMIRCRVRLVGLDFINVDYSELIANDIPVIENLENLKSLPNWGFRFSLDPNNTRAFATV